MRNYIIYNDTIRHYLAAFSCTRDIIKTSRHVDRFQVTEIYIRNILNERKMYGIALAVLILLIVVRILNINRVPEQSLFYSANAKFLEQILKNAPKLTEP